MLSITKFMMLENALLKRDFEKNDTLYYFGNFSIEETLSMNLLVQYINENSEVLNLPRRHKKFRDRNGRRLSALEENGTTLTIINIIRNAFSHGHYKYDFDREMVCIDSIYLKKGEPDYYHVKVDIPIKYIDMFNEGISSVKLKVKSWDFKENSKASLYSNIRSWNIEHYKYQLNNKREFDYLVDKKMDFETFYSDFNRRNLRVSLGPINGSENAIVNRIIQRIRRNPDLVLEEDTWKSFSFVMNSFLITNDYKKKLYNVFLSIYKAKRGNIDALRSAQHINSYLSGDYEKLKQIDVLYDEIDIDDANDIAVIYNFMVLLFSSIKYPNEGEELDDLSFLAPFLSIPNCYEIFADENLINYNAKLSDDITKQKNILDNMSLNGKPQEYIDKMKEKYLNNKIIPGLKEIDRGVNNKNISAIRHLKNAVEHCNVFFDGTYLIFRDYKDVYEQEYTFEMKFKKFDLISLLIQIIDLLMWKDNMGNLKKKSKDIHKNKSRRIREYLLAIQEMYGIDCADVYDHSCIYANSLLHPLDVERKLRGLK